MKYLYAIIIMEVCGFLSIFFLLILVQAFLNNEEAKGFLNNNIEHGISLKVLLFMFAIMGVVLARLGFLNVR